MTGLKQSVVAAVVAVAAAGAGCGGGDLTISDAKAKLSKDCQQGKTQDKPLCDCIAGELQSKGKSAKQIDDLRKRVNAGKRDKEVVAAAVACGRKRAS
jgi:hypothetical protein